MRHQQIEAWALEVVERVTTGSPFEDDRVELKADWPKEHRKTARQMAGHANQAGGDTILWLIGLDEKKQAVVPTTSTEMADWWPKVERCFDELAPEHTHLAVPVSGGVVHALVLDTSRAPYLVNTDGQGVEREVPWRSGNKTRSARRSELLRAVVEEAQVTRLECFGGSVVFDQATDSAKMVKIPDRVTMTVHLNLYLEATGPCTLPKHHWKAVLQVGDLDFNLSDQLRLDGPSRVVPGTQASPTGFPPPRDPIGSVAYISGSGLQVLGNDAVRLDAERDTALADVAARLHNRQKVTLTLTLPLANSTRSAHIEVPLYRAPKPTPSRWDYSITHARFFVRSDKS